MTSTLVEHTWSTDELSLAAFVWMQFKTEPEVKWDGESCSFAFPRSDELLLSVVKFVSGESRVEPKEYHMHVTNLRKKMFNSKPSRRT